jgi:gamma-glutamyl-gamma-aminobutyrate hydrolase PuuD
MTSPAPLRPRIGLTAWCRTLTTAIGPTPLHSVSRFYVAAVEAAGGIPLLFPAMDPMAVPQIVDVVDGLIVTGGEDVEPGRYEQPAHPKSQVPDARRDAFEVEVLREADGRNLPTFCVCRGVQVLNVARGGSLFQDIPELVEGHPEHMRPDSWNDHVHDVRLAPGSRLAAILGTEALSVNSLHHQAVDRLGQGLQAVGWAPDGLVEAVEDERSERFLLGVQWHPENLFEDHPEHLAPFRALVKAAAARRRPPLT